MKPEFKLYLNVQRRLTMDQASALMGAGFDDSIIGANSIEVDDRAGDLVDLVREAIGQVQAVGLRVVKVETPEWSSVEQINRELAEA